MMNTYSMIIITHYTAPLRVRQKLGQCPQTKKSLPKVFTIHRLSTVNDSERACEFSREGSILEMIQEQVTFIVQINLYFLVTRARAGARRQRGAGQLTAVATCSRPGPRSHTAAGRAHRSHRTEDRGCPTVIIFVSIIDHFFN